MINIQELPKVDIEVLKKLPQPISWWIEEPELVGDILMVPIKYIIHDGTNREDKYLYTNAYYRLSNIATVVKKVLSREIVFDKINDIRVLRERRDRVHYALARRLASRLKEANEKSKDRYSEMKRAFLLENWELVEELVRHDTILSLIEKEKWSQSENNQRLIKAMTA